MERSLDWSASDEVRPGVRLSAALAVIATAVVFATWPKVPRWLASERWSVGAAWTLSCVLAFGGLLQFGQWASGRTYRNFQASIDVGRLLPPGTLVHGKLANGLALENRIRPVFVGDHFGNYDDRFTRDDVRYLLTYIEPREGFEGPIIREVLEAYPHRRLIATFEVAESAGGRDRAALFEKGPRVLPESSADRLAAPIGLDVAAPGDRTFGLPGIGPDPDEAQIGERRPTARSYASLAAAALFCSR